MPQVAQLKAAMDKEQAAYEEEWGALTKMIEEDRRAQVGHAPECNWRRCQAMCSTHAL